MQDESQPIKTGKPKDWAAGAPAVISSLKHVMSTAGPVRGTKALLELNQFTGFDCPSCAWPDPDDHRAPSEFCENGAKAVASEATKKLCDPRFFRDHSIEDLEKQSDYWHDQQGRIATPMVIKQGSSHYEPISWDKAFALIADHLRNVDHPDESVFYTSGRASNEAAFLYQLFVRHYGTQNLPDCSNMCHESSGSALVPSIGIGKGTVTLDDIYYADTVICVGQNPGTNHPRMLASLEQCVENGGKIVGINPLIEAGLQGFAHPQKVSGMLGKSTPLSSQYLQVKPNGDMAIFRGIAKFMIEREEQNPGSVFDREFIEEHTEGVDAYINAVNATSWETIIEDSGIAKEEIEKLTDTILSRSKRLITCWAMGITQQHNAVNTIREIVNVHLLIGALGRDGAGLCPVRGHSNVQGDRTMGIYEKAPESFHLGLEKAFDFKSPRKHGYDVVESLHAMHEGKAKVFIALGGNFLQATPDTPFVAEAMKKLDLSVHIVTKLNRSHLVTGKLGLILPCLGRSERDEQKEGDQFVTCENSMGVVHMSTGRLTPASPDCMSEPMIVARIAEGAIGNTARVRWRWMAEDYGRIRDAIEASIDGFENFNERVAQPGGFYLPNGPKVRQWTTPNGKANFSGHELDTFKVENTDRLVLQTLRSHDQYNTTIYGLDDRYRGIGNERNIVFLNPEDMTERGLKPLEATSITSYWKGETRQLDGLMVLPYDIPRGSAAAYFPEANPLIHVDSTAHVSNTPTSKAVEVTVKKL